MYWLLACPSVSDLELRYGRGQKKISNCQTTGLYHNVSLDVCVLKLCDPSENAIMFLVILYIIILSKCDMLSLKHFQCQIKSYVINTVARTAWSDNYLKIVSYTDFGI